MNHEDITPEDLREAAEWLAGSHRGQSAMRHMLAWLDDDGLGLDADNQFQCLLLLQGAWGPFAGTAREAMQEALRETKGTP